STGEVMAIGRTIEESLQKAVRSLEADMYFGFRDWSNEEIREILLHPTHERLFVIYRALRNGYYIDEISGLTRIDPFFINKVNNIIRMEEELKRELSIENLRMAKRMGFSDEQIAGLSGKSREEISDMRRKHGILPTYKMVDTCAAEFAAATPYYYSTYEETCEASPTPRKKVLIVGSGPIRIGQGIEFDYCTVHAVAALREQGIEAHIINNNPETVSTDYDTSDKLFFEPLTLEDVMNVIEKEKPYGIMMQFGGQTSVNMALPLEKELRRRKDIPTKILGTTPDDMDVAEDRERFNVLMKKLGIPQPNAGCATTYEGALKEANRIGYPVLVRPSYVLGGRAMEIVYSDTDMKRYMREAVRVSNDHPVLIDDFLDNAVELDVDAVSDGKDVFIGAIMEHIEEAGIHSGDSACVIPTQSLGSEMLDTVRDYTRKIALALRVVGLVNIQMAIKDGKLYVLEANPRASRTVPFVSKAVGVPLAKVAAKVMMGNSLRELGQVEEPRPRHVAVKEVLLPFDKLPGTDPLLGPEMKSTGEVMGIDYDFGKAFYKAEWSARNILPLRGSVFISLRDEDKPLIVKPAKKFASAGLRLICTHGTAEYLSERGISSETVRKVSDGSPNVMDLMQSGSVDLVINTYSGDRSVKDGCMIRRRAVDLRVPYITTVQAAIAAADAIESLRKGNLAIKSLGEYHGV
ncbi:MAG TPA: carbamoyl-phosphate synthase large subunit, partial [Candidatus Methanoperedenaceae archaeon]|nr:carbamoyl-phosphate synthase large subunit [Candidatus Methanoperedenaceae archaeon]